MCLVKTHASRRSKRFVKRVSKERKHRFQGFKTGNKYVSSVSNQYWKPEIMWFHLFCYQPNHWENVDPGPRNGGKKSGKEGKKQTNQQPPLSYRYLAFIHHLYIYYLEKPTIAFSSPSKHHATFLLPENVHTQWIILFTPVDLWMENIFIVGGDNRR